MGSITFVLAFCFHVLIFTQNLFLFSYGEYVTYIILVGNSSEMIVTQRVINSRRFQKKEP